MAEDNACVIIQVKFIRSGGILEVSRSSHPSNFCQCLYKIIVFVFDVLYSLLTTTI